MATGVEARGDLRGARLPQLGVQQREALRGRIRLGQRLARVLLDHRGRDDRGGRRLRRSARASVTPRSVAVSSTARSSRSVPARSRASSPPRALGPGRVSSATRASTCSVRPGPRSQPAASRATASVRARPARERPAASASRRYAPGKRYDVPCSRRVLTSSPIVWRCTPSAPESPNSRPRSISTWLRRDETPWKSSSSVSAGSSWSSRTRACSASTSRSASPASTGRSGVASVRADVSAPVGTATGAGTSARTSSSSRSSTASRSRSLCSSSTSGEGDAGQPGQHVGVRRGDLDQALARRARAGRRSSAPATRAAGRAGPRRRPRA